MDKITLATLPEATAQQVFDQVAVHLLTQRRKCTMGGCRYRVDNLRCAAGCLIGDDEYQEEMEGESWETLRSEGMVPLRNASLINSLQFIHDSWNVEGWKNELMLLAEDMDLSIDAIKDLPAITEEELNQ